MDRAAVEAMPEGHLEVTVPESLAVVAGEIEQLLTEWTTEAAKAGLRIDGLRLVTLTEDIASLTRWWQRELEEPESGVTPMSAGIVAGRTLTWRRSSDGMSLAVVLLAATVPASMLARNLLHELVHVHEAALRSAHGRAETPLPMRGDIPGIKRWISERVLSEYLAESLTARVFRPEASEPQQWSAVVRERHDRTRALTSGWSENKDSFWGELVTEVSDSAVTIGRVLGRLAHEPALGQEFIESLAFAPAWRKFALATAGALAELSPVALREPVDPSSTIAPHVDAVWEEFGVEVSSQGYRIRSP